MSGRLKVAIQLTQTMILDRFFETGKILELVGQLEEWNQWGSLNIMVSCLGPYCLC